MYIRAIFVMLCYLSLSLNPPETKGTDKVEFECKAKTEADDGTEMKDKIKFKISHDNKEGLIVKVEYEQETELMKLRGLQQQATAVQEVESETSFEVVFDQIIEYRKPASARRRLTAAEEAYDWETDEIVSTVNLADWTGFTGVEMTRRRLQSGDAAEEDTVYTFSLATLDSVAAFDFTIAQAGGDNAAVTANKMKIDVRLTDYPYMGESTNVALLSTVKSKRKIEIEYNDDDKTSKKEDDDGELEKIEDSDEIDQTSETKTAEEEEEPDGEEGNDNAERRRRLSRESQEVIISFDDVLETTGIRPFGEYTWAKEAEVISSNSTSSNSTDTSRFLREVQNVTETIQVVATSPSDGSDRLAFSFVGGEAAKGAPMIYWDPETGVNYATTDDSTQPDGNGGGVGGRLASDARSWTGGVAPLLLASGVTLLGWAW